MPNTAPIDILTLWKEVSQKLYPWLISRTHDPALTGDILQEVFIKVQTRIHTLKETHKVGAWVFRIAQNTLTEHYRKQAKTLPSLDTAYAEKEEETEPLGNLTEEFAQCLIPMIRSLPEPYQEAVYLSEINGLSQKDLALRLGISYSGAKSRVQRGRTKLKELLLACCEIEFDIYGNILHYEPRKKVIESHKHCEDDDHKC